MFEAPRRWIQRNRTNLAIGAGVLSTAYLAGQYVLGKVTETRQRMNDDRLARENLRRRFRQNQEDCTYTILALLPTATENTMRALPVEDIIQELQSRKTDKRTRPSSGIENTPSEIPSTEDDDARSFASSNYVHASQVTMEAGKSFRSKILETTPYAKKTKIQLWNLLKISSITRALTLIYTLSLLTLLTRIQLNLLGRRTYLSSVVSLAAPSQDMSTISLENRDDDNIDQAYGNDFDTNRKYLTFSWWLLQRGWHKIMERVEAAVKEVFGQLTPREDMTFEQLSALILEVRKKVEGATEEERRSHKWLRYLLPPRDEEEHVLRESGTTGLSPPTTPMTDDDAFIITPSLRRLLDETSDLVDSPTFTSILTLLIDSAYSLLVDDKIGSQIFAGDLSTTRSPQHTQGTANDPTMVDTKIQESKLQGETVSTPERKVKLATILAVVARQAHTIGSGGSLNVLMGSEALESCGLSAPSLDNTNEYLAAIETVGDLEAFAAVIYSSNFDIEAATSNNVNEEGISHPQLIKPEKESQGMVGESGKEEVVVDSSLQSAWNAAVAR